MNSWSTNNLKNKKNVTGTKMSQDNFSFVTATACLTGTYFRFNNILCF